MTGLEGKNIDKVVLLWPLAYGCGSLLDALFTYIMLDAVGDDLKAFVYRTEGPVDP